MPSVSLLRMALGACGRGRREYAYDVFGSVRSHTRSSTEWSFTGEHNDPTGLEYLRARYYDSAIGRFLSRDPVAGVTGMPQSLNRYAYVMNNPALLVDPLGLDGGATVIALEGGGMMVCGSTGGCILVAAGVAAVWCLADTSCRSAAGDILGGVGDFASDRIGEVGGLLRGLPGPFHEETRQASEPPPPFNGRGPGEGPSWDPSGNFNRIPLWAKAILGGSLGAYLADKLGLRDLVGSLCQQDKE